MILSILDPNEALTWFLSRYFQRRGGHIVSRFSDPANLTQWINQTSGKTVVIMEMALPTFLEGVELIMSLRDKCPKLPIIILTKLGYDEVAIQAALRVGATAYVSKGVGPIHLYDTLMGLARQVQRG